MCRAGLLAVVFRVPSGLAMAMASRGSRRGEGKDELLYVIVAGQQWELNATSPIPFPVTGDSGISSAPGVPVQLRT
jgi:hypothetical protein